MQRITFNDARECGSHAKVVEAAIDLIQEQMSFGLNNAIRRAGMRLPQSAFNWDYILNRVEARLASANANALIPVTEQFFSRPPNGMTLVEHMTQLPHLYVTWGRGKKIAGYVLQKPEFEPVVRRSAEIAVANIKGRVSAYSGRQVDAGLNGVLLDGVVFGRALTNGNAA